jgi:hypothetical protein
MKRAGVPNVLYTQTIYTYSTLTLTQPTHIHYMQTHTNTTHFHTHHLLLLLCSLFLFLLLSILMPSHVAFSVHIYLKYLVLYPCTLVWYWYSLYIHYIYKSMWNPFKWTDSAISATPAADRCIKSSTQSCNLHRQILSVEWSYWRAQFVTFLPC